MVASLGTLSVLINIEARLNFSNSDFMIEYAYTCPAKFEVINSAGGLISFITVDESSLQVVVLDTMLNSDFAGTLITDRPTFTQQFLLRATLIEDPAMTASIPFDLI